MPKGNQGNPQGGQQGNRDGDGNRNQGGGRPQPAAKGPGLQEALEAMLMQDWFREGMAETIAGLLESNTAAPAVRDWMRDQLNRIMAEGEEARRDALESWAEDAQQLQEMAKDFQSQHQEMQQLIRDEQRNFEAIAARAKK